MIIQDTILEVILKTGIQQDISCMKLMMRWCDGSYFENQDYWRFTGIAREVYARPKLHAADVRLNAGLENNFKDGVAGSYLSSGRQDEMFPSLM